MSGDDPRLRGPRRAILASVGLIWASSLTVPVVALVREPRPARQWLGVVGVLVLIVACLAALHAAATPSVSERRRRLVDPDRSAREAAEAQHLAATALTEVREAVHDYRAVDLADQLVAVENVLREAGIRCTVRHAEVDLPAESATQLALALREGCTNVLRHSTAEWCTIDVGQDTGEVRMTIANDGAARAHRPDVAVVDLQMPGLDGLEVTTELARVLPSCAVVILTGRGRPPHLRQALDAGAKGFLPKGSPGGALADVIRRVHGGTRYVDPALAADALTAPPCPLTQRELEVLRLAEYDTPVSAIARRTSLSAGTVRNHLSAAVTKLGVTSRAEAFRIAHDNGWL